LELSFDLGPGGDRAVGPAAAFVLVLIIALRTGPRPGRPCSPGRPDRHRRRAVDCLAVGGATGSVRPVARRPRAGS